MDVLSGRRVFEMCGWIKRWTLDVGAPSFATTLRNWSCKDACGRGAGGGGGVGSPTHLQSPFQRHVNEKTWLGRVGCLLPESVPSLETHSLALFGLWLVFVMLRSVFLFFVWGGRRGGGAGVVEGRAGWGGRGGGAGGVGGGGGGRRRRGVQKRCLAKRKGIC